VVVTITAATFLDLKLEVSKFILKRLNIFAILFTAAKDESPVPSKPTTTPYPTKKFCLFPYKFKSSFKVNTFAKDIDIKIIKI